MSEKINQENQNKEVFNKEIEKLNLKSTEKKVIQDNLAVFEKEIDKLELEIELFKLGAKEESMQLLLANADKFKVKV